MPDDLPKNEHLPQSIKRELVELYGSVPGIPASTDDAILNFASARLAGRRRSQIIWRVASIAAAAAILIFAIQLTLHPPFSQHPAAVAALAEDLNGDGRVDIVDALYLAKQVERSQAKPRWDFNNDGAVDRRDADAIATRAVSLKEAPPP
jgi:hypothetical protein